MSTCIKIVFTATHSLKNKTKTRNSINNTKKQKIYIALIYKAIYKTDGF